MEALSVYLPALLRSVETSNSELKAELRADMALLRADINGGRWGRVGVILGLFSIAAATALVAVGLFHTR